MSDIASLSSRLVGDDALMAPRNLHAARKPT